MVILVDTNILVDVLMKREPYRKNAEEILTKCASREVIGYLAAHSLPNLFYILRKAYSQEERRTFIKDLCSIFCISDLTAKKILVRRHLRWDAFFIEKNTFAVKERPEKTNRKKHFTTRKKSYTIMQR